MTDENKKNGEQDESSCNEGKTPFESFDELMTKLLAVPKEELDEQRAQYGRQKERKD